LPLSRVLPAYSPRSARLNHCGPGALAGMLAVRALPAHARGRQRRSGGLLQGSCQKAQRSNGRDPSKAVFSLFRAKEQEREKNQAGHESWNGRSSEESSRRGKLANAHCIYALLLTAHHEFHASGMRRNGNSAEIRMHCRFK
jgi:hypothetical protein